MQGQLGMGKTTALDHVRDQAVERDFEVLETRGIEADTALGFGALLTLLRPIDHELDALVGDFADDLRSAVTLGTRHPTDDGRVRLALYRAVLAKLYPDRPVRAALIWTEVPDLMELSAKVLDDAVVRLTSA